MRVVTKEELGKKIIKELKKCLFVYPTDTVYGLGCNAEDRALVNQIRNLKKQFVRPMSVVAPGKKWIEESCEITEAAEKWLDRLPGPYTLILKLKKKTVSRNTNLGSKTIGVRIPKHWISKIIEEAEQC